MNILEALKSNTLPSSIINRSFVNLLAKWKSWRLEFNHLRHSPIYPTFYDLKKPGLYGYILQSKLSIHMDLYL